jgi:competence protein ComEC
MSKKMAPIVSSVHWLAVLLFFLLTPVAVVARGLDIYFIDVEGGAATLIVTPHNQSVLIDCGWKQDDLRDVHRIQQVVKLAGITQIDYFVLTHYHTDHMGPILQLSQLMPIERFYDHGLMQPEQEHDKELYPEYLKASQGKRQTLKPGELIPLKKEKVPLKLMCVVSDGRVVPMPVGAGAGPNRYCDVPAKPEDTSDNAKSLGLLLSYGDFDFIDLGDLTWNVEQQLVCPDNPLGKADLYMVTHHGINLSSNPALVKAIEPTVSIMCNGPKKGGSPEVVFLLKSLPSLEAAYQLHRNVTSTEQDNTDRKNIANWDEKCNGQFIKVSVEPTGKSFHVSLGEKGKPSVFQTK